MRQLALVATILLIGCGSGDPHKSFADGSSLAASATMLVDARLHGRVPQHFAERLLEAERADAHTLPAQLPYDRVSDAQRDTALATMSRLGLVFDELASDVAMSDDSALARDARALPYLQAALDSLAAAPSHP
jgi:hypothetical protein